MKTNVQTKNKTPKLKKMDEPFTRVPNRLIRSLLLDVHDKMIAIAILSCGETAFPSYTALQRWAGIKSRNRIAKSIRRLEQIGILKRHKFGKRIYYVSHWNRMPELPKGAKLVSFEYLDSIRNQPESVSDGDSIKLYEKEKVKSLFFNLRKQLNGKGLK